MAMMAEPALPVVLLVDDRRLRRAELASLISEWSGRLEMTVLEFDTSDLWALAAHASARLCIYNAGGTLQGQTAQEVVHGLHTVLQLCPIVVISDSEASVDILTAFRLGARGFVSTSTDPKLFESILHFMYEGGSYLPPSVLDLLIEPPAGGGPRPGLPSLERSNAPPLSGNDGGPRREGDGADDDGQQEASWLGRLQLSHGRAPKPSTILTLLPLNLGPGRQVAAAR